MTDQNHDEPETYYAEARSWALDRADAVARSARTAWIVAGVAVTIAGLEALALIALAPLKTVVPYTVLVDRTTGFTQTVDGTHPQVLKPQAALTQSLLAQYVIARESFDINAVAEQYRRTGLWSAGDARKDYLTLMPANNPQSPLNVYPRSALVTTSVAGVTPLGPNRARVHFATDRRDAPTAPVTRSWWVAELDYHFSGEPMAAEDRLVNPLGFVVTRYQREQEALPQLAPGTPGSAPMGGDAGAYPMPIGPRASMAQPGAGQ